MSARFGHAHHFLSRLERLKNHEQLENAKLLYNDAGLLKVILESAQLPPGNGDIAISLDDPVGGPWVIVSRDGKFITCLADGMSPKTADAIVMADAMRTAAELVGRIRLYARALTNYASRSGAPPDEALVGWALKNPERFALEDALAFAGLAIVQPEALGVTYELALRPLREIAALSNRCLRRADLTAIAKTILSSACTCSHVLAALAATDSLNCPPDVGRFATNELRRGNFGSTARTLWALSKVTTLEPPRTREGETQPDEFDAAAVAIDAIGRFTRGERNIQSLRALERRAGDVDRNSELYGVLRASAMMLLEPVDSVAHAAATARASYAELMGQDQAAKIDDSAALAALCHASMIADEDAVELLIMAAPHFLGASYEELYLPRSQVEALTEARRQRANTRSKTA